MVIGPVFRLAAAAGVPMGWRHTLDVSRPRLGVPHLGPGWDGATLALLTDLHVGPVFNLRDLERVVRATNALAPDLVILGGDLVRQAADADRSVSRQLAQLRAALGVFAVMGNHDFWGPRSRVPRTLRRAGIDVLRNEHRILHRNGDPLCLAGVDDLWEGHADLPAALAGVPEGLPRILLSHNPDLAEDLPASPRVDLVLSGHTHGGQILLPLLWRYATPLTHLKYLRGYVQGPRCGVYVSRGLGVVGIPLRFRSPPELPLITLRSP